MLDIKNLKTLAGLTQKLRFLPFLFEISSVLLENALRALSDKTSVIINLYASGQNAPREKEYENGRHKASIPNGD